MTTVTITGTVKSAYLLTAPVTTLSVAASGYVKGNKNYGIHTLTTATSGYVVLNSGRIDGGVDGVVLIHGGTVTNGAGGATSARIAAPTGVAIGGVAGVVTNLATIAIANPLTTSNACVVLVEGGSVTNGSSSDKTALLTTAATTYGSSNGVIIENALGTVTNFGTIDMSAATVSNGIVLKAGGLITNGSTTDTTALVHAKFGVYLQGASGAVVNYGTFEGGVNVLYGGSVTNGSAGDTAAEITGSKGVILAGSAATLTNFGTVTGTAGQGLWDYSGVGVVVNGSNADRTALIQGVGTAVQLAGTVTNFGTIAAINAGGSAIDLTSAASRVIAESGSQFVGAVNSGAGALTVAGGTVTLSGGLVSSGAVNGAGTLALTGGASTFTAGAAVTVADVSVSGAAVVNLDASLTLANTWSQSAGALNIGAGATVRFAGVGDSFAGTLGGAGTVIFSGGSDTLGSLSLTAPATIASATVTLSGTIDLPGTLTAATGHLIVGASPTGGATLAGGGVFVLTNLATNTVTGAGAAAQLINGDRILGAGQLGAGLMTLVNQSSGIINANNSVALVINTGANTIANAGALDATGTGGLSILSAVSNTGVMFASGGTITVNGAVSGAGLVKIRDGAAQFAAAFSQNVTFLGAGVLSLAKSQTYLGSITGFSLTGSNTLDLKDIAFGGSTKAIFSGTSASGTLTVTDGTHTAKIKLVGNYTASVFKVSTDGHGGTNVVDPPATAAKLSGVMASFGASPGMTVTGLAEAWRSAHPALIGGPGVRTV